MKRVFLIILDSFGIGAMEDAVSYGDVDVNTLRTVSSSPFFHLPNMGDLGLFQIDGVQVKQMAETGTHRALIARMILPSDTGRLRGYILRSRFPPIRRVFRRRCWMPSGRRQEGAYCVICPIPERQSFRNMEMLTWIPEI